MPESPAIHADQTLMHLEAKSAAEVVAQQFSQNQQIISQAVERIRAFAPRALVTMARGSSDHAATYAKYLVESQLGLLTASASPSISSVYQVPQKLDSMLYLAISQSGASPDLLASVRQAKAAGALTLALVNVEDSPLAKLADIVIPLRAGSEKSVAATKSYIATLAALAQLVSVWKGEQQFSDDLQQLPSLLSQAWQCDWRPAGLPALQQANNMFVIGRGFSFAVAQEAALKFKETCGLHAEGYSAAEVKHGPMAIVKENFPVLVFSQEDGTRSGTDELVKDFKQRGATLLYASESELANLPVVPGVNPLIAPILLVQSFYRLVNELAVSRGYNPDTPPHLNKVTETM